MKLPLVVVLAACGGCALAARGAFASGPVPLEDRILADSLDSPVAMAVAPDGRVFIAEQPGRIRVVSRGRLSPRPFATLPTIALGEEGLLGIALDPEFARNGHLYVVYTAQSPARHNRVVRLTAAGDTARAGATVTLADLDRHEGATHVGGGIAIGPDGMLYVGTGDNDRGMEAQNPRSTLGKILRLGRDGTIPSPSPFDSLATGPARAVWARGFRNAFTLAFSRATGRLFVNDVGASAWEEIEEVRRGDNHAWPIAEGPVEHPKLRSPVHAYDHAHGCAVTGGAFYEPRRGGVRALRGRYLFTDLCAGEIRWLDPDPPHATGVIGVVGSAGPVALAVAGDGGLLVLARGNRAPTGGAGSAWGTLRRIDLRRASGAGSTP